MKIIKGDVDLQNLYLEELPAFLRGVWVDGNFTCSHNKLRTLKNSPSKVTGNFLCSHNRLETLEGGPRVVGNSFFCCHNQLRTLEGAPRTVGKISCVTTISNSSRKKRSGPTARSKGRSTHHLNFKPFHFPVETLLISAIIRV